MKSVEIDAQLTFNKGVKIIQGNSFNHCCWNNLKALSKRLNLTLNITPYIKVNSEGITDLNLEKKLLLMPHTREDE